MRPRRERTGTFAGGFARLGAAAMIFCVLCLAGLATPAWANALGEQPDVQVLLLGDPAGQEMVDVTYRNIVPPAQVQRDLAAIAAATGTTCVGVDISNKALPLAGVRATPMTGVTFVTAGSEPIGSTTLRLEPWIVALKNYPKISVTYIVPPQFAFNGLRTYKDDHVSIQLVQNNSTFSYRVRVLDPRFDRLNLPLMQPTAEQIRLSAAERRLNSFRLIGLVVLSAFAAALGYGVYTLLSRLT
jgi:hypothetical protein